MRKRNLSEEISAIKDRSESNTRYGIIAEIEMLEIAYTQRIKLGNEVNYAPNQEIYKIDNLIYKYIPIAIVACFQSFFRSAVKEFIDFGAPYSTNARKFNQTQSLKFDLDVISAIQTKRMTIGDVISHILSYSSYEDINSHMSTLINTDFTTGVKLYKSLIYAEGETNQYQELDSFGQVINDIHKIFELRHIFCHEATAVVPIDSTDMVRYMKTSILYLTHANDYLQDVLYPNPPTTEHEIRMEALKDFGQAEEDLSKVIEKIKNSIESDRHIQYNLELFDKAIEQWKQFREANARFHCGDIGEDGSIYQTIFLSYLTEATKEKKDSLLQEYDFELRRHNQIKINVQP